MMSTSATPVREPIGLEAVRRFGRRSGVDEGLVPVQVSSREWALEGITFKIGAGGIGGAGRTERRRKDDHLLPHTEALRRQPGRDPARWPQRQGSHLSRPGPRHWRRYPGDISLPRHHRRQPSIRPSGCNRRRTRGGLPGGQHPRLHRFAAGRIPDDGGRARLPTVWRRKAAPGDSESDPEEPGGADPRRSDFTSRLAIRSSDSGRAERSSWWVARPWSSPIAFPRSWRRTRSWFSTRAGWSNREATASFSITAASMRSCSRPSSVRRPGISANRCQPPGGGPDAG